ncbi:MAG: ribonuclease III [Acidobacteriota bacterium]
MPDAERMASLLRGGSIAIDLEGLEERLGYCFKRRGRLLRALSHRSFANEREDDIPDNEVMEFLGDAVLGLVVSELLYRRHPQLSEGQMSKLKAFLVSSGALARRAEEIDLGSCLLLGRGEEKTAGRAKDSLLANAFEAVIAAVYLDGGLEAATEFVDRTLWPQLAAVVQEEPSLRDYKSMLQERLQARDRSLPAYRVVDELGPDHDKLFRVELSVNGKVLSKGEGKTKKAAEQAAAEVALAQMES